MHPRPHSLCDDHTSGNDSANTTLLLSPHPLLPCHRRPPTKNQNTGNNGKQNSGNNRQDSGNISGNTPISRNTPHLPPAPNFSALTRSRLPTGNIGKNSGNDSGNDSGNAPTAHHSPPTSPDLSPRRRTSWRAAPSGAVLTARSPFRQHLRQNRQKSANISGNSSGNAVYHAPDPMLEKFRTSLLQYPLPRRRSGNTGNHSGNAGNAEAENTSSTFPSTLMRQSKALMLSLRCVDAASGTTYTQTCTPCDLA